MMLKLGVAIVVKANDEDHSINFVLTNAKTIEQAQFQMDGENPEAGYKVLDILQFHFPEGGSIRPGARTASYDALVISFNILQTLSQTIGGSIIIETLLAHVFAVGTQCRNHLFSSDGIEHIQSLLRPESG